MRGKAGARPRVGRRRNDGDLWVEWEKRRNREKRASERYSTLCYSSSSSSSIRSAAISATFVTDPTLRVYAPVLP